MNNTGCKGLNTSGNSISGISINTANRSRNVWSQLAILALLRRLLLSDLDFLSFDSWTRPSVRQNVKGRDVSIQKLLKEYAQPRYDWTTARRRILRSHEEYVVFDGYTYVCLILS